MKKNLAYFVVLYAFIILVGGLIGFLKASSVASIVMSSFFSVFLFISALAIHRLHLWGFYAAFGLSLLLMGFFAYRFFLSQQFMPSGLMMVISALMVSRLLFTKSEPVTLSD